MMNLTGYWSFLTRFLPKTLLLGAVLLVFGPSPLQAQLAASGDGSMPVSYRRISSFTQINPSLESLSVMPSDSTEFRQQSFPDPNQVMYKSLMIPGWGQVINRQVWKVPIVYALLGGLTYYSIRLTKTYHDYRAAYYNMTHEDGGQRFGPTPQYLESVSSSRSLKNNRNFYRNRRDFIYISIGLAYGLNAIDAYVFAHMRSFNVSDELSIRSRLKPQMKHNSPMLTLKLQFVSE